MPKPIRLTALFVALALLMSGCMLRRQEQESPAEIDLPEPTRSPKNMILGEQLSARSTAVTLFFASNEGAGFTTVIRNIRTETGESLLAAAVNLLLSPGSVGESAYSSMGDTRLLSCEYSCGIATVNLSIDARSAQTEQELMSLVTAIGNTLLSVDGVEGVNVLIGGQSPRFSQLPLGTQTAVIPSVTAAYAQLQAEKERLVSGNTPISRTVTLYFPANDGRWLIPELREMEFISDDFATPLIEALKDGPYAAGQAVAVVPEGVDLLEKPRVITLTSGEHALTLNFSSTLTNYLAFSGMEVWQLIGTAALTLNSFMPEVDGLRVLVNGEPIAACEIGDISLHFPEGMIRREDFCSRVGSTARLFLMNGEGDLTPVDITLSRRAALSPRSLLYALFRYGEAGAGDPRFPVAQEIRPEDLLGIQVENRIARVNLSAGFYRSCQLLSERDERGVIYAIVNTLCQLRDIRSVRFLVEGLSADTLSGGIYLRSALLPNPGIVINSSGSHAFEE